MEGLAARSRRGCSALGLDGRGRAAGLVHRAHRRTSSTRTAGGWSAGTRSCERRAARRRGGDVLARHRRRGRGGQAGPRRGARRRRRCSISTTARATRPTSRRAAARWSPLQDVYAFDPLPREPAAGRSAATSWACRRNLWTEHIRTEDARRRTWPSRAPPRSPRSAGRRRRAAGLGRASSRRLPARARRATRALGAHAPRTDALATPPPARLDVALAPARPASPLHHARAEHDVEPAAARSPTQVRAATCEARTLAGRRRPRARRVFLGRQSMNPCWILRGQRRPDRAGRRAIAVARSARLPFNFQIGADASKIRFRAARDAAPASWRCGRRLRRRADRGLPLAPAAGDPGVTVLQRAELPPRAGRHDLCFTFTQREPRSDVGARWVQLRAEARAE